ncbi:DEP domain-containing mTOR-interacting protein [Anomaloglossus baeobatrachus]
MAILSSSYQKRAEVYKKQIEVILAGDQLRQRLHNERIIKERPQSASAYANMVVANELVGWLVKNREAPDRETAVKIMQVFMSADLIHHARDDYKEFEDLMLLYRFRDDDGTLNVTEQISIALKSQRIFEKMMAEEDCILQVREENSVQYRRTFIGSQILDWLVDHEEVATRDDGEKLCRTMLQYGIIQHDSQSTSAQVSTSSFAAPINCPSTRYVLCLLVIADMSNTFYRILFVTPGKKVVVPRDMGYSVPVSGKHQFSDSDMLFRFAINPRRRRKFIEVLECTSSEPRPDSPDSPFCLRKLSSDLPRIGFVVENEPVPIPPAVLKRSASGGASSYTVNKPLTQVILVPKRPVTVEELRTPGKMYILRTLSIMGDAVGWGFMARGTGPTYIHTLDPTGPAIVSGMKVCQFIKSVNGINCLHLDYHTIYKRIVAGPRLLIMEVLEPTEGSNCLVETRVPV